MSTGVASRVLAAFADGATSVADAAARTGLPEDTVRAAVDQLVRLGRMDAAAMQTGCPSGGCGSCASGAADGTSACGAPGPSATRRGPVLVQLRVRR